MKKLKLSLQGIEGAEVLSREQLKKVMGGTEPAGSGNCGNVITNSDGLRCVQGGLSKSTAMKNSADFNTGSSTPSSPWGGTVTDVNWCCASCANFYPCEGEAGN